MPQNHPRLKQFTTSRFCTLLQRLRLSSLVTAASLLGGCITSTTAATPEPTIAPAPLDTQLEINMDWRTLAPGLEQRIYRPQGANALTQFTAVRIDPAYYTFRVHYQPGQRRTVQEWRSALPDAAVFVNANFFDPQGSPLGLVVSDGATYGRPFQGFGGFVQVQDGQVRVRSNILEPFAGEPLEQAVQAFPMLVTDGRASHFNTSGDRASRRTVAGQDSAGRIILLVSSSLVGMRLVELSQYLPTSDLDLVNALNLDGGGSSLLVVNLPEPAQIPSFDPVPVVLAAYPR